MTPLARGAVIALVHVLLVTAVAGVLLYERRALPSAWVLTTGVDPVLPIRGRYVSLNLVVEPRGELPPESVPEHGPIVETTLSVEDGKLIATVLPPAEVEAMIGWRGQAIRRVRTPAGTVWTLSSRSPSSCRRTRRIRLASSPARSCGPRSRCRARARRGRSGWS
jgi:hypothetical protein